MAKKEAKTDLWVYDLLKDADILLDPQGCSIKEIDDALKTASKRGTGKTGFPEYVGVVKDFVLIIEDKADLSKHIKKDGDVICQNVQSVTDYAVMVRYFMQNILPSILPIRKLLRLVFQEIRNAIK